MLKVKLVSFFLILSTVSMISCVEVYFESPQPRMKKGIENFPNHFNGNYKLAYSTKKEGFKKSDDFLRIKGNHMMMISDGDTLDAFLNENIVLRRWKEGYVLSLKGQEEYPNYYSIFKLKTEKGVNYIQPMVVSQEGFDEFYQITKAKILSRNDKRVNQALVEKNFGNFENLDQEEYFPEVIKLIPQYPVK